MVPDKFNMVDMGGIDLIMMQGEEVSGLYNRLVESIAQCRYQCLYNWFFDGVVIPPTYVKMEVNEDDEVAINEGVTVSPDDVIHIHSIEPPAPDPEIIPLLAEENGIYSVPTGVDGFSPVTVDVPSYTPVIQPLSITENGVYNPSTGVDGFSPVSVDVPSYVPVIQSLLITQNGVYNPSTGVDGFSPVSVDVPSYVPVIQSLSITQNGVYTPPSGVDGYSPITVAVGLSDRVYIVKKDDLNLLKSSSKPGQNNIDVNSMNFMPYRSCGCFQGDAVYFYYASAGSYLRVTRSNNKVIQFLPIIPARCNKLYLEIAADASGQSYPISTLNLVDGFGITGYYSGQWSGQTLKSYILTNTTDPGDQPGLTLTRTSATVVPRQVAEIDLTGINVDCYFTYFGCRSYFDIYEIYAE